MTATPCILLTGATGFIGGQLARIFLGLGWTVVAPVRRGLEVPVPGLVTQNWSADPARTIETMVEEYGCNFVVHTAGRINGSPEDLRQGNSYLTGQVVKGLSQTGGTAGFIFLSSVSAERAEEPYGQEKRVCEQIIQDSGLEDWCILRPSLVYGPGDNKNVFTVARLIKSLPIVPLPSRNTGRLQPLHVADLADAVAARIQGRGRPGATYVLSGPRQETLWDMAGMLARTQGVRPIFLPVPLGPVGALVRFGKRLLPFLPWPEQQIRTLGNQPLWDHAAAQAELGFSPRTFETGVSDVVRDKEHRG